MNVYVLSALSTYLDSIEIVRKSYGIKGVIGLSEREASDAISGYHYYMDYCTSHSLDFHPVESYSLTNKADKANLLSLDVDVLLVLGWQRLIPEWLINHCSICAIGAHGSADGITMGRGRSPQNWALILGKQHFYISIFRIDPGIDSGDVIDTRHFDYNTFDTIQTSYHKVSWLTGNMISDALSQDKLRMASKATVQEGEPRYLPQRKPEDGAIDWNRPTMDIHNFVRALTKPYPGAFSTLMSGDHIRLWKGIPFEFKLDNESTKPGEIVSILYTDEIVVRTGDGYYLIQEWSIEPNSTASCKPGDMLQSEKFDVQLQRIVDRHYSKYPDLIISEDITSLLK